MAEEQGQGYNPALTASFWATPCPWGRVQLSLSLAPASYPGLETAGIDAQDLAKQPERDSQTSDCRPEHSWRAVGIGDTESIPAPRHSSPAVCVSSRTSLYLHGDFSPTSSFPCILRTAWSASLCGQSVPLAQASLLGKALLPSAPPQQRQKQ